MHCFLTMLYLTQATFGLKNILYSSVENNFVLKSFVTYNGFIPLTSQISMQSFIVLRCLAAEKCCLKLLEVQLRGDPRVIFQSVQNLNSFRNHVILCYLLKTCHTAGSKKVFVLKSLETNGRFTPSNFQISMQGSFVVLRCLAAKKCSLKFLKIQQRGNPRVIHGCCLNFSLILWLMRRSVILWDSAPQIHLRRPLYHFTRTKESFFPTKKSVSAIVLHNRKLLLCGCTRHAPALVNIEK